MLGKLDLTNAVSRSPSNSSEPPLETPRALPKQSFLQLLSTKIQARPAKEQLETRHIMPTPSPTVSFSEGEAIREIAQLKREMHKMKMENSLLFKELDIARRREQRLLSMLGTTSRISQTGDSSARMKYVRDPELCCEVSLDTWLASFLSQHPEVLNTSAAFSALVGSALSRAQAEQEIERTMMKRQFVRDFSSLTRVNGIHIEGSTESERVLAGYFLIQNLCVGKPPEVFRTIPLVATQHLGLLLYEKLMAKYSAPDVGLTVKQAWHHYIDIVLSSRDAIVYLMAVFEAQNLEDATFPTLYIRGQVLIDLTARKVSFEISAPVFDYMQFVAVV